MSCAHCCSVSCTHCCSVICPLLQCVMCRAQLTDLYVYRCKMTVTTCMRYDNVPFMFPIPNASKTTVMSHCSDNADVVSPSHSCFKWVRRMLFRFIQIHSALLDFSTTLYIFPMVTLRTTPGWYNLSFNFESCTSWVPALVTLLNGRRLLFGTRNIGHELFTCTYVKYLNFLLIKISANWSQYIGLA